MLCEEEESMSREGNQKTIRESIIAAFLEAVAERPLSSITVGDLCQEVDISRNAFYTYFESKDSLLSEVFHVDFFDYPQRLFPLFGENDAQVGVTLLMKKLYENILSHKEFYAGLEAHNREEEYSSALKNAINDAFLFTLDNLSVPLTPEREYIISFVIAGQIATIIKWIRAGFPMPPEQMAKWYISWTATAMTDLFGIETFINMRK